ncbi:NAC domain-containing protein 82-like protein [Cinnamomum micranthum f. kanehirae]|uniref:NAC domain-containing protein 82-like protein n=1 Tax=Cinnamomum micranthum f. kanehirae TaxID=337451 RepID=A0A443P0C1_9MAGN|nr:NAC domain-containing protein 82-like protein [Cinnamomum micranthum f. kanehirae]
MANLSKFSPPPGTRFLPCDVVLIMYYLKRKVAGRQFKLKGDIPDIALNNFSPSELREMSYPKTKDLEGFFFCSLGRRYSKGQRKNRSGKGGSWNVTGKDKPIYNKSREVGLRTTLTFYRGKGRGTRTDWRIHEYRLEDKELPINEFVVLCKIFEKKSRGPKTDEDYESPVEDDADDCVDDDDANGSVVSLLPAIPSSSLAPQEGQNTVATTSTLDFENRPDAVLPPLPTHTATTIVPRLHLSSPGHVIHKFVLNNVSDEDGNTCNGSGSRQVDSVPSKSTVEDLDTHGIYKGSEDISDHRKINSNDNSNSIKKLEEEKLWQHHHSPGSIDWMEVKDLSNPTEEDWDAYFRWEDLLIPVAADVSNQGTSFLPAPNATPVLPAHEAMDSSENIWGHREPTCDSAAYSPLKAGEIVGQYAPQSLARGKQLHLHLGLECISKERWFLTNVQFHLGSIVACPA